MSCSSAITSFHDQKHLQLFLPVSFLDDEGSVSKMPRVELSDEELKAHFVKGTLGKLTVPTLRDACRTRGLKSGPKKQELLDALIRHFEKN